MLRHTFAAALLTGTCLGLPAAAVAAPFFSGSLTAPVPVGGVQTAVALTGITTPSQSAIDGAGFAVTFANVAANQGVVVGQISGRHAVPVAGGAAGAPKYLTGDFGSDLTSNRSAAGTYFSVGSGAARITITFDSAQQAFALLWGSIDPTNRLDFFRDAADTTPIYTVRGSDLSGVIGRAPDGNQGFGGSAWLTFSGFGPQGFEKVQASSGQVSFEFAGAVGSTRPFDVPAPAALALFGVGLFGLGLAARRRPRASA